MIHVLRMRLRQAWDTVEQEGLAPTFKKLFFKDREAIPARFDLSGVDPETDPLEGTPFELVEVDEALIKGTPFTCRNRAMKAAHYLGKGYCGYAIVRDGAVVGDVWYTCPGGDGAPVSHPDLTMLRVQPGENDIYAFDMYIDPGQRGENIAVKFKKAYQRKLQARGFSHVYGYYWIDNVAALWMHRMLKFEDLPAVRVSRFLSIWKIREKGGSS
jgi:hypothetical protein